MMLFSITTEFYKRIHLMDKFFIFVFKIHIGQGE